MVALSVLDLCFVTSQTPPRQALAHSIALAKYADQLGLRRGLYLATREKKDLQYFETA